MKPFVLRLALGIALSSSLFAFQSTTTYMNDDGTSEQVFNQSPGSMCWLQAFDPVGGADTLTEISTMNGLSGGAGEMVNAQIWGRDHIVTGQLLSDGISYTVGP